MRLHRCMRDLIRNKPRLRHLIGFGKTLIGIAEYVVIILLHIARLGVVDKVRLRLHRFFGIKIGRQRLVLDVDQFERFLGDRLGNSNHTNDVVADVAHLVESQRVLVVTHRKNAVGIGSILAHYDGNYALALFGAARVDALDACVRIMGMQNLTDQHARHAEIVGVLARPGGLRGSVDHRGRLADNGETTHIVIPSEVRNLLFCALRNVTSPLIPSVLLRSPIGWLHTSGYSPYSGTDCC